MKTIPLLFVATWPPRLVHALARLFGATAALGLFCECCPSCGIWGDDADE